MASDGNRRKVLEMSGDDSMDITDTLLQFFLPIIYN